MEQGTISVVAYEAKFHVLSYYALQIITLEKKQIEYFVKGLNLRIQLAALSVVVFGKSFY